jgi:FAD/FMN-containing dehydrogenase/Fe-S oxidoreductase
LVTGDLLAALRRSGVTDVDASNLTRALYASDASLYRVVPQVVVRPRDVADLLATLEVARTSGVPLTMRGAGTSIAGNAVGTGMVLDSSRHLRRILAIDAEARTARVQPGVVHAHLQQAAAAQGLRFGPDPSTHSRCTIGGMIGNNACGSRALGYGRTSDNVVALEAVLADGTSAKDATARLAALVDGNLATIRTEFGRFTRQVSGYAMEHLLPERGRSLERFLVGSEGTLAIVTEATVNLVVDAPARALVVLGFPDLAAAADVVPALLELRPVACEGLDERIVALVRSRPELPDGAAWLLVEFTGDSEAEAAALAQAALALIGGGRVVVDPGEQAALWRIREDGAGLAARATQPPGLSGWEDAAVPPARLADYLRSFEGLLAEHGLSGAPYGHLGEGCVHVRIDFDPSSGSGRARYRDFVEAAADLVVTFGGSFSGEHGDGRARSELLPKMYSPEALALFGQVKHLLDPQNLLNPGVLVDPRPFDADLRGEARRAPLPIRTYASHQEFVSEVERCTGVGKCIATHGAGTMCPSYRATLDEKDSTRGRARVLQEMVDGRLVSDGWESVELGDALDLCLSCKACAAECPTGVDMAALKTEYLAHAYAGRRRPRSHRTLGRLPALAKVVPPRLANLGIRFAPGLAKRFAGIDSRRSLPAFAAHPVSARPRGAEGPADVVVWVDTFTDRFAPQVVDAARSVLEAAGLRVRLVADEECCGLTWLTTGQIDEGARRLGSLIEQLAARAGDLPVIGLEPSCLAVLRHDAPRYLAPEAAALAARVQTLGEFLTALPGWTPPRRPDVQVIAQPHCHQAAVLGWDADHTIVSGTGADLTRVDGCCGMAGDFGMERGHYEISVAVAEQNLLPAVRKARSGAVHLADGFSCRTQLADLSGVRAVHLAEFLADLSTRP